MATFEEQWFEITMEGLRSFDADVSEGGTTPIPELRSAIALLDYLQKAEKRAKDYEESYYESCSKTGEANRKLEKLGSEVERLKLQVVGAEQYRDMWIAKCAELEQAVVVPQVDEHVEAEEAFVASVEEEPIIGDLYRCIHCDAIKTKAEMDGRTVRGVAPCCFECKQSGKDVFRCSQCGEDGKRVTFAPGKLLEADRVCGMCESKNGVLK